MQIPFMDGLRNIVANLGTGRDKASHSVYVDPVIDDAQLSMMYRGSAIARKIVDMPAQDSFREWREWQADASQISALEAEERRLGLQGKLVQAKTRARLFGGAVVYIGTGDTDAAKPLIADRIRRGGIKYLTVISRNRISAGPIQNDPRLDGYGNPSHYSINGEVIHPSRVAVFKGEELPDDLYAGANIGWGDSSLTSCLSDIRNLDATIANVASLVFEAKIDVMGIDGFNEGLKNGGADYEKMVLARGMLLAMTKGNNGMLLTDVKDTYQQKSASFATLPDIIDRFMQMTSAASGIPMTLLFGTSPSGLNGSGDVNIRGYYDRVKVIQTLENQPEMALLDECLIRSALGNRPADIYYNWRPLWQPTTAEKATTGKTIAETFMIASQIGDIPEEALANSLVNALTESGIAPGLEADYADYFNAQGNDDNLPDDDETAPVIADARPQTLYVSRKLLNGADVIRWAKAQGFKSTLPADDMHVTIAFSRAPVDWMECGTSYQSRLDVASGGPRQMDQFGEARVLLFTDGDLKWRHEEIKGAGATWDHPEYQPHVMISYDPDAPDIADIEPYQGPLIFGPEIFSVVKENWQEGIKET